MNIELEEYIPLKIVFCENREPINYISYSQDKYSLLEFSVGVNSKHIHKITLLLSKEYFIEEKILELENSEEGEVLMDNVNVQCACFKTILYANGVKIVLSKEKCEKYIKRDRVYVGVSIFNEVTEICVCDMSFLELQHLKNELELQ